MIKYKKKKCPGDERKRSWIFLGGGKMKLYLINHKAFCRKALATQILIKQKSNTDQQIVSMPAGLYDINNRESNPTFVQHMAD